jgi:hypothetical protein
MSNESAATYPIDAVNRVKRREDRGAYDHATVHELLDAAAMCQAGRALQEAVAEAHETAFTDSPTS